MLKLIFISREIRDYKTHCFHLPHFILSDSVKEHIMFVKVRLFEYICSYQALSSSQFTRANFPLNSLLLAEYPITSFKSIMIK